MELSDPCMPDKPIQAKNYFLACYLVSLVQGETILGGTIRSRTLRHYLSDAIKLFDARNSKVYHYDITNFIDIIIHTVSKYEKQPNRRNMISDSMMLWLLKKAKKADIDSDIAATVDWIILGRYAGFRRSEWSQSNQTKFETIDHWPGQPPKAMIFSDFSFLGQHEDIIGITIISSITGIKHLTLRWRFQKNGQNGEEITFARNDANPNLCPVRAALRICQRAIRLQVPRDEPIGVFSKKGTRRFITDNITTKVLRSAASTVIGLKQTDPRLTKWSSHSIRVTAANLLHRAKMVDSYIQKRLRWRSNTFLDYLRNTIYAADQHSAAMDIPDSNLPPVAERVYREDEPHEQVLPVKM